MTLTHIGTIVSSVGYVVAIYGGWLLYTNTPLDRPHGTIPVTNDINAFQRQEQAAIASRATNNRRGFLLITVGAGFQLIGTLMTGFSN